ncbi:hypothetical protein [Streptomyces sp. NPDC058964]|uniref:hypothetical protein n=1 Tax=Streptomyces sp. NPDC058964 TaxID=3346681 RepID=UPI0036B60E11
MAVALLVVGGVAVLLVVTSHRNKDGKKPAVSTAAEARGIARRVALTPPDWGSGFTKGDPYESEDTTEGVTDQNCDYATQPIADALSAVRRNVGRTDGTALASSQVVVYRGAEPARADAARLRSEARRCPKVKEAEGNARWEGIHEVALTELKGFDDVVAEEGRLVVDGQGRKSDNYYTNLTGRKGQFVMQAYVTRNGSRTQAQNRRDATNALALMLSRL